MQQRYKRVLIKLSGESLKSVTGLYDSAKIADIAQQLIRLAGEGLEIAIVIGGGNI